MKMKNFYFWIITIVITLSSVVYQRMTGPTYPLKGKVTLGSEQIKYKLLRTYGGSDNAEISIDEPTGKVSGTFSYRRYKSNDEWTEVPMLHQGGKLLAYIPHQPPAGKVMYDITLTDGVNTRKITEEPVVLRFKGHVPGGVLLPHILLMFLAMLLSTRTGVEVIAKGPNTLKLAVFTTIFLFIGGIILGPIVQKYAFDAYWTGWPIGTDLTDNKTALALIVWLIAIYRLRKNSEKRGWALVAAIVMLMVYLIPHSMFGSEIDHTAAPQ
ncbi:MAG: hypothetical protein CVU14_01215 [Bacteroidetes bacterium HGW-Bacteroidetes-9]|jgi:hypothetical protein|nr:MAG: hypothetical protein CVU14_01215 [Bacteroidetes bacterium HGW-Bacteroidetes-9]